MNPGGLHTGRVTWDAQLVPGIENALEEPDDAHQTDHQTRESIMKNGKQNGNESRPPTPGSEIWRRVPKRSDRATPQDEGPEDHDADRADTNGGRLVGHGTGPNAEMRLRTLGAVFLEQNGTPVNGRAARPYNLALLAYLAACPGRSASRDKVIACFWPDRSTSRSRHRLSVALHVLRTELGRNALISNGDLLTLSRDRIWTDVEAFREAVHEGQLEEAVALYSGPFLDGFHLSGARAFEGWVEEVRQATERLYRSALKTLIRESEEAQELRTAIRWYEDLVAAQPFCARVTMAFMKVLARSGHVERAVARARAYATLVEARLGIPPDPDVLALARDLVAERQPESF